jgi:hypothetical protein
LSRFADGPLKQFLSGPVTMTEPSEEQKRVDRAVTEDLMQTERMLEANDRRAAAIVQKRSAEKDKAKQELLSHPKTDIGKESAARAEKAETDADEAERAAKKARAELRGQVAGPHDPHNPHNPAARSHNPHNPHIRLSSPSYLTHNPLTTTARLPQTETNGADQHHEAVNATLTEVDKWASHRGAIMGTLVTDDLTSYTFESLLGQDEARRLAEPIIHQINNPEDYRAKLPTNLFFIGHSGTGATSSVITCNHL